MLKRFISGLTALLLLGLCGCSLSADKGETVSVQSVAQIAGTGTLGAVNRFAGKIVSGQTEEIKRDESKTVQEVLVKEGDHVQAGDVLFTYDTQAMEFSLEKLELELEGINNTITAAQSQISELETERSNVASAQQLAYTLQIQEAEANIREAEYNKALKQREIETMQSSMDDTQVCAGISGRVMSVGTVDGTDDTANSGSAFVTISDLDTFRAEGNINELNAGSLSEGMQVLIRSRVNENLVWHGTIEKIDWENPVKNTNDGMYYYSDTDDMTTSSKYPFYIALDSWDGLILGQHVYIEPDCGQETTPDGLWLPEYYLDRSGDTVCVWAAGEKDTLEKRSVTLGEYDETLGRYKILAGLTEEDYIAFPDADLQVGAPVSYYEGDSFDSSEDALLTGSEDISTESLETAEALPLVGSEDMSTESFEITGTLPLVTAEDTPLEGAEAVSPEEVG